MTDRHMDESTAQRLHFHNAENIKILQSWQERHPNVADYRVTEALQALQRAGRVLGYLVDDVDPEGDAARAAWNKRSAKEMADAVWNDLGDGARVADVSPVTDSKNHTAPTALLFHYASRDVRLARNEHGDIHAEITAGPGTGRMWSGLTAEEAVKAMVVDLYGTPCADGYGTGRDSCPGCDASGEQFEERYYGRLGAMGASPLV
jgi:hypothetical protein